MLPIQSTQITQRLRTVCLSTCALGLISGAAQARTLLYLTTSTYAGNPATVTVGQALPNTNGVTAIANGAYPGVFANDTVDGNFGITAPIFLRAFATASQGANGVVETRALATYNVTATSHVSTSFSSKSELGLHVSTDGHALTLGGYLARPNVLDVSNANTPDNIDPTNTDTQTPTYRAVVQIGLNAKGLPYTGAATPVDSYSGNNLREAVLATNVDGSGQDEYLMVGNGGNGSSPEPVNVVNDTGVQAIAAASPLPMSTVIGQQQGTPGAKTGFQYGFSVAQIGQPADKSGKDDNFRGEAISNDTLFVTKGSGGNGVNTVYQVTPPNGGLPLITDGPNTQVAIAPGFPTGLAANIVEGDATTEFYPFGVWFANPTTMYVADEGPGDLTADPNAGLQKWVFDGTVWHLAYVIQAGLALDQSYTVSHYPAADAPATIGLRHVTGIVNGNTVTLFATTSTDSNLGDPGADPNQVVRVVDQLSATTLPTTASFTVVGQPVARSVYRGVAAVTIN
jgi:hypothetical protein